MDESLDTSDILKLTERLRHELRALRINRGYLGETELARSTVLCFALSRGNRAQARSALIGLLDTIPIDPALLALSYCFGLKSDKPTLLGRLNAYALANKCHARTARRRSEIGIEMLSQRIAERMYALWPEIGSASPVNTVRDDCWPKGDTLPITEGHYVTVPVPDGVTNLSLKFSVERPESGGIAVALHLGEEWLSAVAFRKMD